MDRATSKEPCHETNNSRTFTACPVDLSDRLREHGQHSASLSREHVAGATTASASRGEDSSLRLRARHQSGMERADQRHLRPSGSLPHRKWLSASGLVTDVLWQVMSSSRHSDWRATSSVLGEGILP